MKVEDAVTARLPALKTCDVMLDLETMGTRAGAPVIAIGATWFDPWAEGLGLGLSWYQAITLESCMAAGLRPDAGTIEWWMQQGDEARAALFPRDRATLPKALEDFATWLRLSQRLVGGELRLWCHGPSFDAPILEAAYLALGMKTPWPYHTARCTRTVYELAGIDVQTFRKDGTHHNALDDAKAQALAVQAAYRSITTVVQWPR